MSGQLFPTGLIIGQQGEISDPNVRIEFTFYDRLGDRLGSFKFVSREIDRFPASDDPSRNFQNLTADQVFSSPTEIGDLPDRETDAVVRTVEGTWATQNHRTQLLLAGNLVGEWNVLFQYETEPFNLSGVWRAL